MDVVCECAEYGLRTVIALGKELFGPVCMVHDGMLLCAEGLMKLGR